MERYCHTIDTEMSTLTLVSDGNALVGIYFPQHRRAPVEADLGTSVSAAEVSGHRVFVAATEQLTQYFAGQRADFDLPLGVRGTAFQERVWAALREIPYAQTRSYGQLAEAIGSTGAARAVGMANGRNPISIVVPCHRVIGSNGALTGYAGGQAHKRALLDLETRCLAAREKA